MHVREDVARQWAHLHGVATPARRLDPRILGALVDLLDIGTRAFGLVAQHIVRLGHTIPGVQALGLVVVLVPGVRHKLLHLLGVARIDRMDLAPVAIDDGAAGQLVGALVVVDLGMLAKVHHVETSQSAAMQPARMLVQRSDGQHIRQIDVAVERIALVDARLDKIQALHVDGGSGRAILVDIDGARHATNKVVGVRVLATKNGLNLDPLFVLVKRLKVVRNGHEIGLWWQDVGWTAPIAVAERAQLPAFYKLLDAVLDIAEVPWRRQGMGRRDELLQLRCFLGVGLEAGHHVHPVQCMQVVEMHHVVLHHLRLGHHLADQVRVLRDLDAQCILHSAHRGQRMAAGTHAADALDEGPGIARVTPLENDLQATPHGSRGDRVADDVVAVEVDLATHVPLDAGHGVDNNALAAVVELE